jgi:catalase
MSRRTVRRTTISKNPQLLRDHADALARNFPFNRTKANEYGSDRHAPPVGESVTLKDRRLLASTLTDANVSRKSSALDAKRSGAAGQRLTTNHGVPVADNQSSLKAGARGPALLEDFILREKITHFDHERIPERIVHARGSAAHGIFRSYRSLTRLTRATVFAKKGKTTPVFVRFSTVAGERGSADTARDIRGFAVKFYTDEGNWDLVGNNIPIFFIQDAIKFPDLIHAVKPEPHHGMPQAASAHDTFWDFASLMPESTHVLMWIMSDRGIPRSYRMMQGFGVHTFRLVNARGESVFCKFHWTPLLGTHSLVWDEAVKISGADPDFHRRDLWEAIEAGQYPEWELGLQIFTEKDAEKFSFDVLDATKLVPEELVPIKPVGRMTLNRNPDNFFVETEQVAFCTAHVIPGIDFSNDPLLAGRIHSYVDTQISRLGGPNFHEIPINAPIAAIHNNQRDGMHRQSIHQGRVAYEPNSLGGGCPFQAGTAGFTSFREPIEEDKVRAKPEKFAEHYNQATLFWSSQTEVERRHIVGAFRFELSKVTVPAIRERMVSSLANVSLDLARQLAEGLGFAVPKPMPRAISRVPRPEIRLSPALSLTALPGEQGIGSRKVAVLVAEGAASGSLKAVTHALAKAEAIPVYIGRRMGSVKLDDGSLIAVDSSLESTAPVLYDSVVLPDGDQAVAALVRDARAVDFVKEQFRHCKPVLILGAARKLVDVARIPLKLPNGDPDPGLIFAERHMAYPATNFIAAMTRHRVFERDTDPPRK